MLPSLREAGKVEVRCYDINDHIVSQRRPSSNACASGLLGSSRDATRCTISAPPSLETVSSPLNSTIPHQLQAMAAPLVSRASTSLAATACRCSLPAGASLAKSKKQERRSLSTGSGTRPANAQAGPSTRSYASVVKKPIAKPAVCSANRMLVDWKGGPDTKVAGSSSISYLKHEKCKSAQPIPGAGSGQDSLCVRDQEVLLPGSQH